MKKSKLTVIIIGILVVLTAVLAVVHLTTRQQEQEGALQVVCGGKTVAIAIEDLKPVAQVDGTVTNNAGEEKKISGPGILVSDVLKLAGVEGGAVKVASADEYVVTLTAAEVAEEGKAWLMIEEDSLRLIVFGDQGAKRNVKNVVRLTVE